MPDETLTRPTALRRAVFAWIAVCFAISALGLGARHGCSASTAVSEPAGHHHDGSRTPPSPMAQCDCVGHACSYASIAPPAPGITIAVALQTVVVYTSPRSSASPADAPHLLPYATAPPSPIA